MSSTTTPTYTAAANGNVIASGSLAASATSNANLDFSAVFEGQLYVKNTPGGTIAATRGLKIEIFRRHGSTPTTDDTAMLTYTLPSAVASTPEGQPIFLGPGKYNIKLTNLDASNAVTVEVTSDTVTGLSTS